MLDPIAIQLGPLAIRWYALCIVTGLILAVYLTMKEAPRKKIIPDDILDFILVAFPLAILGARLYYVIFRFDYYSQNLGEIFAIWNGGLAIYGGLITGALVLYIFADRKLINTWDFLDIAAPSVMIAQSLGRWVISLTKKLMVQQWIIWIIYLALSVTRCILRGATVNRLSFMSLYGICLALP